MVRERVPLDGQLDEKVIEDEGLNTRVFGPFILLPKPELCSGFLILGLLVVASYTLDLSKE